MQDRVNDSWNGFIHPCRHRQLCFLFVSVVTLWATSLVHAVEGASGSDTMDRLREGGVIFLTSRLEIPETAFVVDEDIITSTGILDANASTVTGFRTLVCYSRTLSSKGLVSLLSKTRGLRYVTLSGPGVTDEVIAALGELRSLESIQLKGPIHGRNLEQLLPLKQKLQVLSLQCEPVQRTPPFIGETFGLTDEAIKQIGKLERLGSLRLVECGISDEQLVHLRSLTDLQSLALDGNPIEGSGLSAIAELPRLKHLQLSSCRLSDEGMAGFPHFNSLASLGLTNNQIGDATMAAIAKADLNELYWLTAGQTDVTDRSLSSIALLKGIRKLDLSCTRIEHFEALSILPITGLNLAWTRVSDEALEALVRFPKLRGIQLYGTPITDEALPAFEPLKNGANIFVGNTKLSNAAIDSLRKTLPACRIDTRADGFYNMPRVIPRVRVIE